MAASIRVFPAVIAVGVGALAFKGVDIAYAVVEDEGAETQAAASAPTPGAAALVGEAGSAQGKLVAEGLDANATAQCVPGIDYSSEAGISEQEIRVLRSLANRREELDQRENELDTREQTAIAAETRLDEQIAELKGVESQVAGILAQIDAKQDERMASLVRTYESMKPKDAARIFNTMEDETVLVDLAKSMKPAALAAVMASMDSKRAELVTKRLAALAEPPASFAELDPPAG
jgi:flagellar motility protein MotE (MotC chaperone)